MGVWLRSVMKKFFPFFGKGVKWKSRLRAFFPFTAFQKGDLTNEHEATFKTTTAGGSSKQSSRAAETRSCSSAKSSRCKKVTLLRPGLY